MGDKMTTVQKSLLNSLVVRKGVDGVNEKKIVAWDAVGECSRTMCALHMDCPYLVEIVRKGRAEASPCGVQANYLKYVFDSIVIANTDNLTQLQMDRIGFHLLPLYGHLIKFKMIEFTLTSIPDVLITNERSKSLSFHPVYKEIRDTLRHIDSLWDSIGIGKTKDIKRPEVPSLEYMMENGDPTYAEKLVNGRFSKNPMSNEQAVEDPLDEYDQPSETMVVRKPPARESKPNKESNKMIRHRRPKKKTIEGIIQ
jgi:hypothetical protein